MKILAIVLFAAPFSLVAQTTHPVQIGGSTSSAPAPYYSPQFLTIPVGDRVRWTNMSGTHNVNGTLELFPANPEPFDSGDPANMMWSYMVTFTVPGVYNYRCESEGHAETQFGTITVQGTTGIRKNADDQQIVAYPSPAIDFLLVEVGSRRFIKVDILVLDGRVVASPTVHPGDLFTIPTTELRSGNYMLRLTEANGLSAIVRFVKN